MSCKLIVVLMVLVAIFEIVSSRRGGGGMHRGGGGMHRGGGGMYRGGGGMHRGGGGMYRGGGGIQRKGGMHMGGHQGNGNLQKSNHFGNGIGGHGNKRVTVGHSRLTTGNLHHGVGSKQGGTIQTHKHKNVQHQNGHHGQGQHRSHPHHRFGGVSDGMYLGLGMGAGMAGLTYGSPDYGSPTIINQPQETVYVPYPTNVETPSQSQPVVVVVKDTTTPTQAPMFNSSSQTLIPFQPTQNQPELSIGGGSDITTLEEAQSQ